MTTPMRSQYLALKRQYPDIILFFRLGDFYETFDDDAKIVASVCDIVLTSRPVGATERVPLAGVPYHAVEGYVAKLIAAGYKVAIAEQEGSEPPKGDKIVPRIVRRVVTPGTLVEPNLLPEKANNYLAALALGGDSAAPGPLARPGDAGRAGAGCGLAYADITTGEFAVTEFGAEPGGFGGSDPDTRLAEELSRLLPAELLYPARDPRRAARKLSATGSPEGGVGSTTSAASARSPQAEPGLSSASEASPEGLADALLSSLAGIYHVSPYASWHFEESTARDALLAHFGVASLDGYGLEGRSLAIRAAGALLQYLGETQRDGLHQLAGLRVYSTDEYMTLDQAARKNLELTETIRGAPGATQGSLLGVLDATLTPMGGRLLRRWMGQPLLDVAALDQRLDSVTAWHGDAPLRAELRRSLRNLGDLERWTNRAVQGIALPRELLGIREALRRVETIRALVERLPKVRQATPTDRPGHAPGPLGLPAYGERGAAGAGARAGGQMPDPCPDIITLLQDAIADDPPATLATPGVIRPGFSAELDAIHFATRDAKSWIAGLEGAERQRTGIKSLRVGYNKVFGYYIEVTKANAALVPDDYIRKQTLVNAERYITPELKEYEALVLNAGERVLELEGQLYRTQVLAPIAAGAPKLLATARVLAELDVVSALAEVAEANRYVRPMLANDGLIDIRAGRHPVVEKMLVGEPFTPNDTYLSPEQAIVILTGPNMAGKSTFLRQVAHIVLMAQIGSYVPADSARIGLVDRIFTRIGASDEIARGQSTFMVEMVETANILHNATSRSLLILDEIGRGTSTYDGLAIAWAVVEYVHNHPRLRAKTLFATHYHELTDLAERLPHVVNLNVAVVERGETVVFLHKIMPGAADRSYGVHVGQLAGLPRPVVARAQEILADLEASGAAGPRRSAAPPTVYQLPLFSREDPVIAQLRALDVNSLSPLEALNKLFDLQQRVEKGGKT